jgi:hypothetical protein
MRILIAAVCAALVLLQGCATTGHGSLAGASITGKGTGTGI